MVWYDGISNTNTLHSTSATTWRDLSGNSYNGTLSGGTWGDNYLLFDGTDDWVSIAELNYANPTWEIVYKINAVNSTQQLISNIEGGGGGLYTNAAGTILTGQYYITENSAYSNISSESITLGTIYNVIVSYDGSTIKLYKNGAIINSLSVSGTIKPPVSNTIIALGTNPAGSNAGGQYLNGNIYSVRIYNRALTASEITHNYAIDQKIFGL